MPQRPAETPPPPTGGGYLLQPAGSVPFRTPEQADETQRALHRTASRFALERVAAASDRIENVSKACT